MKHQRSLISIVMATLVLVSLCAVCASASVSAASPPGKPIAAGTGPSACILKGTSYMYVFVKGYDGALWYRIMSLSTMGWTGGWTSLGGKLGGSPVALSRSPGILTVYITTPTGYIYERSTVDSGRTWQGYRPIDGTAKAGTGPASSGWSGREDVFWVDASGNLWQKAWTSGHGWWTKISLGKPTTGGLTSSPAAVSRIPGLIDVHARGTNGADYYRSYVSGWRAWATLGGLTIASGTGPALSAWRANPAYDIFDRVDVFVKGTDGALHQRTWTAAKGWTTTWANLGGSLTSSPTAATSHNLFAIELYVRWSNGNVCQKEYYSGAWHNWQCGMAGPPCKTNCW